MALWDKISFAVLATIGLEVIQWGINFWNTGNWLYGILGMLAGGIVIVAGAVLLEKGFIQTAQNKLGK